MPEFSSPPVSPHDTDIFYATMLEQAADGVIIIDDKNKIVFFNAAAEHLWGYPATKVLGTSVDQLVPQEHRKRHSHYITRHRQTGINRLVNTSREITFMRSNGDYVAAELSISTALRRVVS